MSSSPTPLFSVLVANHNHGALVGRAVDSVLQQTGGYAGCEVIVVDDGSSDDSLQRLQRFANAPGVQVVSQPNRGQTAAFARGLQLARGDWVCLLDADDSWLPDKLQRLRAHLATLDATPDTLFLCHDLQIVDARNGRPIASTWFDVVGLRRQGALLHVSTAHHFFPFAVTSGMVFGRALLQRAMDLVPVWDWPMGADGVLGHVAMLLAGEVHYLHEPLACYLVHADNNFASIADGQFRQKPVWHGRWPRKLRLLERVLDSLPLGERDRADRLGYIARVEHAVRAVPSGRQQTQPLLTFVIDAGGALHDRLGVWAADTVRALQAQGESHLEQVWVCTAASQPRLPPPGPGLHHVVVPDGQRLCERLRDGLSAARGGYLCFLEPGDQPDPRFVERHLQSHRFGTLPMLTACDLRLMDADGVIVHAGIQGTAAGWGVQPAWVSPFASLLRDASLAPLPAVVMRRTPLLPAFFEAAASLPPGRLPDGLLGWLLCQYLLQMGGATRLLENLVDLRLPPDATPNASWLSQFIDRRGPVKGLDLAVCADLLFDALARASSAERAYFSEGWESRFVRWLVLSGGGDTAARIERAARRSGDTGWSARIVAALRAPGGR